MEATIGLDMLVSIGTLVFGIGGAWAVIKHKTDGAISKIDENKALDRELASEVKSLGSSLGDAIKESEKTMTRRVDEIKDMQARLENKVTVMENDMGHMKKEQERHGRKITLFGQTAPK